MVNDVNAFPVACVSFSLRPSHRKTSAYTTATKCTERPKKPRVKKKRKCATLSHFGLLSGTAAAETAQKFIRAPEAGQVASFFVGNATPLAVVYLYLRSSRLPSRTAVFLWGVTPEEPNTLTLCRACEFAGREGETGREPVVARAKFYFSGHQRAGGPWRVIYPPCH